MKSKVTSRLNYVGILLSKRDALCDAGPEAAGVATLLILYCFREMNGGVMQGARGWNSRKWVFTCGLDAAPEGDCAELWHWEGDDLIVDLYSEELERQAVGASEAGKKAAEARWGKDRKDRRGAGVARVQEPDKARGEGEQAAGCDRTCGGNADAHAMNLINEKSPSIPRDAGEEQEGEGEDFSDEEEAAFAAWREVMAGVHPATALIDPEHLPDEVEQAARAAFKRSKAPSVYQEDAGMLAAYLRDTRLTVTAKGEKYYRPMFAHVFFEKLENTRLFAERWAAESRWKARRKPARPAPLPEKKQDEEEEAMTPEEIHDFLHGKTDE